MGGFTTGITGGGIVGFVAGVGEEVTGVPVSGADNMTVLRDLYDGITDLRGGIGGENLGELCPGTTKGWGGVGEGVKLGAGSFGGETLRGLLFLRNSFRLPSLCTFSSAFINSFADWKRRFGSFWVHF